MAVREEFSIDAGEGVMLRAVLDYPSESPGGGAALAILHRGAAAGERGAELMDHVAGGLLEAGLATLRAEPRATSLILQDFNAVTLENEVADLAAVIAAAGTRQPAAGSMFLVAFSDGAIAATFAAFRHTASISRLALINPATPPAILAALPLDDAQPTLGGEPLPQQFVADLEAAQDAFAASSPSMPTLIVQAGADRTLVPSTSLEYVRAFDRNQCEIDRIVIARADHHFTAGSTRFTAAQVLSRFLLEPAGRSLRAKAGATA